MLLQTFLLAVSLREPAMVRSEFIYEHAPFPSCHAATLVETNDKGLVAAWFGGTAESAPDVAIYLSRYQDGAWTPPEKVADGVVPGDRNYACYNPVLFQPQKGPLLLFYKVGTGPQTWWGMMTTSKDGGKTWASPHRLPNGILGPIKNKPFELPDGTILCGSSEEAGGWHVHFERTQDLGASWSRTPAVNGRSIGAIQPSILPLGGQRLRAVGRTQQGRLFAIDSDNLGESWGEMRLLNVPNPNSGTDALRLKDGRFVLVYNPTTRGRTPLSVAVSEDGEHWTKALDLEKEPGEYSYPAVIQTQDGLIHIAYTWRRTRIRHVILNPKSFG